MGIIDIIYLVIVGITFIFGLSFAIRMFLKIRKIVLKSSNNVNKIIVIR